MAFTLPQLPFAKNSLAPYISEETIEYHYGKHHQAYVDKLNKLIPNTEYEHKTLEEIIKTAKGGIFNNAAQVWNHTFYWQCLSKNGGGEPKDATLIKALTESFGSVAAFKEKFTTEATNFFGSGWIWLAKDAKGKLEIIGTTNADNPLTANKKALLTCDVWEHAYYIDYRNARAKYIEAFWKIISWDFVRDNMKVG